MSEPKYTRLQPLSQCWEREAITELAMIAHGLCIEAFPNPIALRDKLLDLAENITIEQTGQPLTANYTLPDPAEFFGTEYLEPIPPSSDHDPVVLFDPVTGPMRDSELRKICEDAVKNRAHTGFILPPDELP